MIILLGILQGLTEFLPVSSSGHLTLFESLFGHAEGNLSVNIALHLGTLLTILIFYKSDITRLLVGLIRRESESITMFLQIIVASIPTAIIGFFMKKKMEWLLTDPVMASIGLCITGWILLMSQKSFQRKKDFNLEAFGIDYKTAFLIGVAQGFAVLPGVSRSGSTIVSGLFLGMDTRNAARFSFLISVPAIFGAGLLEFLGAEQQISVTYLGLGAFVSFITGLIAISLMVRLVQTNKLKPFAYYVFLIALLSLVHIFIK